MIKGIGVDIIEIDRIERAIKKSKARFIKRVFTQAEEAYCLSRPQPFRHFAVRFAAKEAVSKALGTGKIGLRWTDIEVCHDKRGRPFIKLLGDGAERAEERGVGAVEISLSFNRETAIASAVATST
ncbi:MAG TPA: holo-[acyl-carrier-protein] synthase [Actinobacteria bacterium]|nr:holo-[acyl-carrier-protein] synthase [Actinomycetota bacterium]